MCADSGAKPVSNDVPAIRALLQEWTAAVQARDVESILSLVTDDVVFLPPGSAPIRSRHALAARYQRAFQRFDLVQESVLEEICAAGEWAFARGSDTLTATPLDGGEAVTSRGYGMSILHRQPDGVWKFARSINNMIRGGNEHGR